MKALIVATSMAPPDAIAEIKQSLLHRIDYMELADRLDSTYLDYSSVGSSRGIIGRIEQALRLDVRLARRSAAVARRGSYDVVFSMSERVGIPLTYLLPKSIKHVVQCHHLLSPGKARIVKLCQPARRWESATMLTRAEIGIAQKRFGFEAQRIQLLLNAIDSSFFDMTHQRELPDARTGECDVVVSVGQSRRDYRTLVDALQTLPHIPARLYIGSIWNTGSITSPGTTLPSNVEIKPYVHPSELRDVYASSRFVVVPLQMTTQWCAGSTVVLQAQAMGKPVIATRIPGMSDYVREGETGLLVDPADPGALAGAIDSLWNDPQRCVEMGLRARQWAVENFSLEKWLDEATRILCDASAGKR